MNPIRISLLHMAPVTGEVERNRRALEAGLRSAAQLGAQWVVTPELCVPGYLFAAKIGTDWILPQPDPWMKQFCKLAAQLGLTVFLSHPDRDPNTDKLYNSVFLINSKGHITGTHSKVKALGGAEAWSSPGQVVQPLEQDGVKVGILVCADAYKNDVSALLKDRGAQVLVSPASWGPGECAPNGEWEQRSLDTGLPIIVCNHTGVEPGEIDYRQAESVVAREGLRLLSAYSDRPVLLSFDWDMDRMAPLSSDFQRVYL